MRIIAKVENPCRLVKIKIPFLNVVPAIGGEIPYFTVKINPSPMGGEVAKQSRTPSTRTQNGSGKEKTTNWIQKGNHSPLLFYERVPRKR
jgi:hypothetical protein